jgi:hypothetical protein
LTAPRLALVVTVAVAVGIAIVYFAKALSQFDRTATQNSALSFADREIAGGNSILIDQAAAYEARALIPTASTYRVVTGSLLRNATSLTDAFVEPWFVYFLMPRRPAGNARWIVCYGCNPTKLGGPYTVRWRDDNGISIGRVG